VFSGELYKGSPSDNVTKRSNAMSNTACLYPIVGAVQATESILGKGRRWNAGNFNSIQLHFLRSWFEIMRSETDDQIPELESLASWSADEIIEFVSDRGFSAALDPLKPGEFAVASVFKLALEWLVAGTVTEVRSQGRVYPAAKLHEGVSYWTTPSHPHPVAKIETKSGDEVFLSVMDEPLSGLDLASYAERLQDNLFPSYNWDKLIFPMVDLDQSVDISWLSGLECTRDTGEMARISQAIQQTRFKMNHEGAKVESVVMISVLSESIEEPKPDFVIDKPFLAFVKRPAVGQQPALSRLLFNGWIDQDDWKDPGSLGLS
jgi:hypothetical protein